MNTTAEKRICIPRNGGMPEGATIPRDPPFFTGGRHGIWIAIGGVVVGYLIALLTPLYDYRTGPGLAVTRIHRLTGEVAFCSATSPCMTANERIAAAAEQDRAEAALAAAAVDVRDLATDTAAIDDVTLMTDGHGRPLFEETGSQASDPAR